MSRWKRKSAASATRASALRSAKRWACASDAGRCTQRTALQLERQPRIVRRLIGRRKRRQRRRRGLDLRVGQLEAVEAAARHEKYLIAAHEARGAQLPREFPVLAQLARLGVTAPLAGPGEFRTDQGEVLEIGNEYTDTVGRGQHHAQPPAARNPGV